MLESSLRGVAWGGFLGEAEVSQTYLDVFLVIKYLKIG